MCAPGHVCEAPLAGGASVCRAACDTEPAVDRWLASFGDKLNSYGDAAGTQYGAAPVPPARRFEYIRAQHPSAPWCGVNVATDELCDAAAQCVDPLAECAACRAGDLPRCTRLLQHGEPCDVGVFCPAHAGNPSTCTGKLVRQKNKKQKKKKKKKKKKSRRRRRRRRRRNAARHHENKNACVCAWG